MEISNLTLTGGHTFQGGGIYSVGKVTVINSIITGNQTTETGGGLTNRGGKMIVINSTISDNSSLSGGGVANIHGGMILINTIISGNEAKLGGGIRNEGTLMVINTTVSNNSASSGGGVFNLFGTIYLRNSIVANSRSGGDCFLQNDTINAEYSLIEDGLTCVNGVNINNLTGDPLLGHLSDNGGGSETHAPLPGSIAIDAGNASLAVNNDGQPLMTDRRGAGFPRIVGNAVDIGAFEYQAPTKKDQCNHDGWKNFSNPTFLDQDQCVNFVINGKL